METLKDIAYRLGTDKKHTRHNYVSIYDQLFKDIRFNNLRLFEIGVALCRSHNMWLEWMPNAVVYGIDTSSARFSEFSKGKPRLILDNVNAGDRKQLEGYAFNRGPWDIIIDDGSHLNSQQKLGFEVLWDYVIPGGFYIIEDTHSSYQSKYKDTPRSLIDYMCYLVQELSFTIDQNKIYASMSFREDKMDIPKYQREIEYIKFHTGMVIIKKRANETNP